MTKEKNTRWQAMAELDERRVHRAAERRFADMLAAAGLTQGRIGVEVLHYLPKDFTDAYTDLFHRIFELDAGAQSRGERQDEDAEVGKAPGRTKGKRHKRIWTIRDHRAFDLKERVDKRLRQIAREIRAGEEAKARKQTRCQRKRCGKYIEEEWLYCPHCGKQQTQEE